MPNTWAPALLHEAQGRQVLGVELLGRQHSVIDPVAQARGGLGEHPSGEGLGEAVALDKTGHHSLLHVRGLWAEPPVESTGFDVACVFHAASLQFRHGDMIEIPAGFSPGPRRIRRPVHSTRLRPSSLAR